MVVNPKDFDLSSNGWCLVISPDSTRIAFVYDEEDWEMGYHALMIRDINDRITIPVCAFRERDPGSGINHSMFWSSDSKVLNIIGNKSGKFISEGLLIDDVFYKWLIFSCDKNVIYNINTKLY